MPKTLLTIDELDGERLVPMVDNAGETLLARDGVPSGWGNVDEFATTPVTGAGGATKRWAFRGDPNTSAA